MLSLSEILAIAVGLFFVYLLLSIVTSYAVELISTTLQMRGSNLADAIQKLLDPSVQVLEGKKQILRSWTGTKPISGCVAKGRKRMLRMSSWTWICSSPIR